LTGAVTDGEEQVGRVGGLDDAGPVELDRLVAEVVEQALARAEQHRREAQPELVDEPGGQVLLYDVGAAADCCQGGPRRRRKLIGGIESWLRTTLTD